VTAQLARLDDLVEVQPFASDIGEYLWFRTLPEGPLNQPEPTVEQATRALAFVFSWIVRWEAFSTRYDAPDRRDWYRDVRPPTTDHPELGTRVSEVTLSPITRHVGGDPDPGQRVTLQIVDAPGEDFEGWLRDLQESLRSAAGAPYVYASVDGRGVITMTFAGSEIDASGLHEVIEGALHEAEESRAERARKHADRLAQHSARLELFRQALLPLVDVSGTPIFSDVRLIPSYPPNPATDPPEPKIFGEWANPECAANSDPQFTGDIWSGLGHQYDFGGVRDEPGFSFLTSEDPIHLALVVEGAFRSSEDRRRASEEAWKAHVEVSARVARELQDAFPRHPREGF
jgi:hypothetical protein